MIPNFALAALAAIGCPQEYPKPDAPFDEVKRFYDDSMNVESFQWRARAIDALAQTHDPRALAILKKRYSEARPGSKSAEGVGREGTQQMRYFVAGAFSHFMHAAGGEELKQFASLGKDDADVWLWYNALRVEANQMGSAAALKIAKDKGAGKFLRAAAIEALAKNGTPETWDLVDEVLALKNLPKPGLELRLLACASASALRSAALKSKRDTPEFARAAKAVISLLDIREIDEATKLGIARELAALFEVEGRERTSAPWIARLEKKEPKNAPAEDTGVYASFMGIQGRGKRFVYVLDFSDSMLVPLTADDKEEFEKGGHDSSSAASGGNGEMPKEASLHLPWNEIRTRLDAARECVRLSLRDLSEDKYFAIVIFGDVAECLRATPGLVKATPANVKAAERELDSYNPGGTGVAPASALKGKTNMDGGLRLAYRLTDKGPIPTEDEYVNAATFTNGADTIFLLTDGIPNWDDFPGQGPIEKNRGSGDPETGRRLEGSKDDTIHYNYPGPYADRTFYMRDLTRLNLFRKVEIHCVGIGEAHSGWLEATARLGLGKSKRVGKDQR